MGKKHKRHKYGKEGFEDRRELVKEYGCRSIILRTNERPCMVCVN